MIQIGNYFKKNIFTYILRQEGLTISLATLRRTPHVAILPSLPPIRTCQELVSPIGPLFIVSPVHIEYAMHTIYSKYMVVTI